MDRRGFGRLAGVAALGAAAGEWSAAQAAAPAPPARKRALMKVGTQHDSSDETLAILAALGVNNICSNLPSARLDEHWSVEGLTKLRERVESFGITLDCVPLPLSSHPIASAENPNLMLGRSPERDREIDAICTMIRNAARAGIPALKYNMSILGVVRPEPTTGRGGAQYSTFSYAKAGAKASEPMEGGPVSADAYWERITYFLDRVVPVAEEHKVRLACHPHDPGMPTGTGWRGVHTVLGSVEGLKRFVEIRSSPYHGLNFCQG
ncbi:MAG TPA: mannonate dehydratase, partial [Vicinamibacteria bacterium]|nr:mannonate dehydratase [Vicinamibacteria bacterium]